MFFLPFKSCANSVKEVSETHIWWIYMGLGPGWYHQGLAKGRGSISYHQNSIGKTQVLAQSAADVKNNLLTSRCKG